MIIESAPGLHIIGTEGDYYFDGLDGWNGPKKRRDGPDRVSTDGYEEYYFEFFEHQTVKIICEIHSDGLIHIKARNDIGWMVH